MQTTLRRAVKFSGLGLHSGRKVTMVVRPAAAETGIWFRRVDVTDRDQMIAARWDNAVSAELCTRLSNEDGVTISTIEHIMAGLAGCGIHNAMVEIDGPEVPVMDGSAAQYVSAIIERGIQELDAPVRALEILKPVEVLRGDSIARLVPSQTMEIDFQIDFPIAAIGVQKKHLKLSNGTFVRELSDSRTFCMKSDIDMMHGKGLALGGSINNAVVYDGDTVVSPGGLRHADEAVRHKMLDALGDLALVGAPILGRYEGFKSGHSLTNALLHALFADHEAYRIVECDSATARTLPGAGLKAADLRAVA